MNLATRGYLEGVWVTKEDEEILLVRRDYLGAVFVGYELLIRDGILNLGLHSQIPYAESHVCNMQSLNRALSYKTPMFGAFRHLIRAKGTGLLGYTLTF
jgi:hypothetical protein